MFQLNKNAKFLKGLTTVYKLKKSKNLKQPNQLKINNLGHN